MLETAETIPKDSGGCNTVTMNISSGNIFSANKKKKIIIIISNPTFRKCVCFLLLLLLLFLVYQYVTI